MFCPKCGTDVGDFKFCPQCGTAVQTGEIKKNVVESNPIKGKDDKKQSVITNAVNWFNNQPSKKKLLMLGSVIAVLLLVVMLVTGSTNPVKERLCEGYWLANSGLPRDVYKFDKDNTYEHLNIVSEYYEYKKIVVATGKYKIDEKNGQIILKGNEPNKIPYAINEYTHEVIFNVTSYGESSYYVCTEKQLNDKFDIS